MTETAAVLKEIKELVDETYRLDKAAKEADKAFKASKAKLGAIMENAEVDKMAGDTCNASLSLKTSVTVPKEDHKKLELFEYIAQKDLSETDQTDLSVLLTRSPVLFSMLTINARSFSSWHDKEVEAKLLEGDIEFKLPMLSPYEYYSVGLRKRTVK